MKLLKTVRKVPLEKFLPELILAVPQVSNDIAESYIRQAAIKLVEQSHCLKREIGVETQSGVTDYLLTAGDGTITDKIDEICDWLGRPYYILPNQPCIPPCAVRCVDICGPGGFAPLSPITAWFEQPNILHVRPVPAVDIDLGYRVKLSVIPSREACDLDEILYERYQPVLVAGALADLYAQPEKPWTNLALSKVKMDEFKIGCARALGDSATGARQGVHKMTTARFV